MLSLAELRRAVRILADRLPGTRLERIVQPDDFTVVLRLRTFGNLLLSCKPELARVSLVEEVPPAPAAPLQFAQLLRARVSGARVSGVRIAGEDRQAAVALDAGGECFELILSILGSRSNLYLTTGEGVVLGALRRLEETRRELAVGEPWRDPPSRVPREGSDRWAGEPDHRYLSAIEEAYRKLEAARKAEELARRIGQALNREMEFLDRKASNLALDRGAAEDTEEMRRKGELLKGVLHEVRPGNSSVAAEDFETGEPVTIPLDPQLSPAANLEEYFERYHREARRREALEEQMREVAASRAALGLLRTDLQTLDSADVETLEKFAARPEVRRLLARHAPKRKGAGVPRPRGAAKKSDVPGRLLPKRYRSTDGLEIWVGRSDEGNDYMTTRLARGNDLFFHLEGAPGSHVILRTEGRADPPAASVLEACELAVHHSRQKGATRADVHVSPVKNVRKPAGAKPGLVYVARGKTIHLRRDAKRLERVLAARIEE